MEISFFGANCVSITTKQTRFVFDDNLTALGGTAVTKSGDVALFTMPSSNLSKSNTKLTIDAPGEYEIADMSIQGIAARAHIDAPGQSTATMYRLVGDDIRVLVTGHIYPELTETQLEQIGTIDIMLVPVGGNGYTLDALGALSLIKKIEPKLVIPTHYDDTKLKFEVPQQALEEALKGLAMEAKETVAKIRLKAADLATDITQLVILERQ